MLAKLPDAYREDLELLAATPVDVRGQRFADLASVAHVDRTTGPNLINRENVQRRIIVTANVAGRDLRGAANEVQARVAAAVKLPAGYHTELGGEFESEAAASRTILGLSVLALIGMVDPLRPVCTGGDDRTQGVSRKAVNNGTLYFRD